MLAAMPGAKLSAKGFATHISTIVEKVIAAPMQPPVVLPRSTATFRSPEAEPSWRSSVDLHLRQRLWWLASLVLVICGAFVASSRVLGGPAAIQHLLIAGMIVTVGSGAWMGWLTRTRRMTLKTSAIAWFIVASTGVCTSILYFGAFSPVGMAIAVFVVFFIGTNDELTVVLIVYLTIALFHAALAGAIVGGELGEPGVAALAEPTRFRLLVTEGLLQLVLFATLIASAAIRHSLFTTVRHLEEQAREIGHHELLLEDARRAFEASLRAAGGGRFSHQIVGAYRLGRLLGEGAMGEVYDATDTRTGAEAAVKLLRREVIEERGIVLRFLNEARIVTQLQTDHIVRVLETADPGASLPYIAMERLRGRDLRQHLDRCKGTRMPLAETDEFLRQIALGVDTAHRAGIIHRDLKPSNLFREDSGTWKVLDFGCSKVVGERTAENVIIGTPSFMSPEQVQGDTVDAGTDIFALGAITYYAITGKPAFPGETLAAIAFQVTHRDPPPPSAVIVGYPPEVDAAVMTALAKDPRRRFATATTFSEAFSRAARLDTQH
jgi:serine/threonine-protein kinase